jgi:hypothetical protein
MTPDITDLAHERDSQGELLPVTEHVTVNGDEYEVEVYPATSGQQNEYRRRLEAEGEEEVSDELTYEIVDEFAAYGPADFGAEDWAEVRPAVVEALSSAALAKLFDAGDPDEFVAELEQQGQAEGN